MKLNRLDHMVLTSANVDACLGFYRNLGLAIENEEKRGIVRIGEQKLNVHPWPSQLAPLAANPGLGGQQFCLQFPESGFDLQDRLHSQGCRILKDACCCENASVYNCFYIEDPDGNLIQIQAGDIDKPFLKSISLRGEDRDACLAFYEKLLGLRAQPFGREMIFHLANGQIRLVFDLDSRMRPGAGDFCILADSDGQANYEELERVGARFADPQGVVRRKGAICDLASVYLRDPVGNLVEIGACAD